MKQSYNKLKIVRSLFFCIILLTLGSCKKYLETIAPENTINEENVFNDDAAAAAVVTNFYSSLSSNSFTDGNSVLSFPNFYTALMSDELTLHPIFGREVFQDYYLNRVSIQNAGQPWGGIYQFIYSVNLTMEGLNNSRGLTASIRAHLLGDTYFLRAYAYFYLAGLFGDCPIVLTTDYRANRDLSRAPQQEVYEQIIADLQMAKSLLPENYLNVDAYTPSSKRITINRAAAEALLARTYLYASKWQEAELEASAVIAQSDMYELPALENVFSSDSKEVIWNLQPVINGWNTTDGRVFILPDNGPDNEHYLYLSPQVINSFEPGDQRKSTWIQSKQVGNDVFYQPYKYKSGTFGSPVTEYKAVLRLAELYLIRAEAHARQGDLSAAQEDLYQVRRRAGLDKTTETASDAVLALIQHERQVELFTEGDRWMNLIRTKTIDDVMPLVCEEKGTVWRSFQRLLPLPTDDLVFGPGLTQNPGY